MRPPYQPLAPELVARIVSDAFDVLDGLGIAVHHSQAIELLADHGARVDETRGRVYLPHDLVDHTRRSAPGIVQLFDVNGRLTHEIGGEQTYFAPGSSARLILDRITGTAREPGTADYVEYVKVVEGLPHLAAQSTAFIPADVAPAISDSYRLYLSLLHCRKPVVTGTFSDGGLSAMIDLQVIVRGSATALARTPLAIFSCCPTSPLAWGRDAAAALIACAQSGIPVELVPMPLAGFIAPVSLAGTLVQQTAESLAGLVISQLAHPGAPVLFGGASTAFDIRYETTPMASVESMLMACSTAQIGRYLELPTHGYLALSDAKTLDAQAGLETAMGAAAAALAGVNEISGPGLLDFGNCFSLEKLVLDDEACAMALRLRPGISAPASSPFSVMDQLLREGHLLIAADTRRHLRDEISFPSALIDRTNRRRWEEEGSPTIAGRAASCISQLLTRYEPPVLADGVRPALTERMSAAAQACGMEALPSSLCEL